jgi:hypothetical protein
VSDDDYVIRNGHRIAVMTLEPKVPVKPKRSRQDQFVLVPLAWVEKLRRSRSVNTWRLATFLLFQHWKSGGRPVTVSNWILPELGIGDPETKRRALLELERLSLVKVERRRKQSPRVTVLAPKHGGKMPYAAWG